MTTRYEYEPCAEGCNHCDRCDTTTSPDFPLFHEWDNEAKQYTRTVCDPCIIAMTTINCPECGDKATFMTPETHDERFCTKCDAVWTIGHDLGED